MRHAANFMKPSRNKPKTYKDTRSKLDCSTPRELSLWRVSILSLHSSCPIINQDGRKWAAKFSSRGVVSWLLTHHFPLIIWDGSLLETTIIQIFQLFKKRIFNDTPKPSKNTLINGPRNNPVKARFSQFGGVKSKTSAFRPRQSGELFCAAPKTLSARSVWLGRKRKGKSQIK